MKKITTALGALIALIFMFSNWVNLNTKFGGGLYMIIKAMPSLGVILLGLALIALLLLIVPIFLRNPIRKVFIVGFCLTALVLLLTFTNLKEDLQQSGAVPTLGIAWFGSLFGFFIAFLGAFIKTKPRTNADGTEIPVRSSLPMLSAVVLLICLPVIVFAYLLLMPPFRSFPMNVDGMPRQSKVQYRKDENYPGVWMAIYGTETLHTVEKMSSAEAAKEQVKKFRESIKKSADESFNRWKNSAGNEYEDSSEIEKQYRKDPSAIYLADEDKPENDYVVYVRGSRANIEWASGRWLCTVNMPKNIDLYSEVSPTIEVFGFAANLPYPPNNTSPVKNNYSSNFTLYSFVRNDLPLWFNEWSLIVVSFIIAVPFLLLIPFLLLRRNNMEMK